MNDRRRNYRTDCRISACIESPGLVNADKDCYTGNIGMKGVFLTDAPGHPVGTLCKLVIHDHKEKPLTVDVRVSHVSKEGVGFVFVSPQAEERVRLKYLVHPYWDGLDYLDGMMLMMRYSKPATELKDVLSLTTMLSASPGLFAKFPHTNKSNNILN